MAITVIEIPKIILNLSLEAGGDLPDATEYFFTGWIGQGAGYYGGVWGEAADQVSITTTAANQRIRIDWEYWHDSVLYTGTGVWDDLLALMPHSGSTFTGVFIKWDYYSMLDGLSVFYKWCNINDPAISTEFQLGTGHMKWMNVYSQNGFRADYFYATSTTLLTGNGYFAHGQLAWRYDLFQNEGPFPMEKSDLFFLVTLTGNTEEHLINAIETMDAALKDRVWLSQSNQYTTNNSFNIVIKGSICGPGSLTLSNISINTVSSTFLHCRNISFVDCYVGDNQLIVNSWLNLPTPSIINTIYRHAGNAFIVDNVNGADGFKPWCRSGTTSYGSIIGMYMVNLPYHQWRYFKPIMPITDSIFENTYISATAHSLTHDYTGINAILWTNVKFYNSAQNYDIRFSYSYIGPGETGYDEINATGLFVDRPDGILRALFAAMELGDGTSCKINVFQPITFLIKDAQGIVIEGATVSVQDNEGTPYSDDTDEFGLCALTVKTYSVEYDPLDPDGYGGDSKTINLNPLSIIVQADGYLVYEAVSTIGAEITIEIALIEITEDPEASGLTNAYESEAMRHLFLNEPILNIGDAGGLLPSVDPGYFYMALLTASPGEAGSIASEATFGGYEREPVPRTPAGWTEFLGKVRNLNQVNFALSTSGSETITHYAVMKELTGSEMIAYGSLDDPTLIVPTWQLQFAPSQMEFNID